MWKKSSLNTANLRFFPLHCDIQKSVSLFHGSYASPACPSDISYIKVKINIKQ